MALDVLGEPRWHEEKACVDSAEVDSGGVSHLKKGVRIDEGGWWWQLWCVCVRLGGVGAKGPF